MPKIFVPACRSCGREEVRNVPSLEAIDRALERLNRQQFKLEQALKQVLLRQEALIDQKKLLVSAQNREEKT